MEHNVKCKKCNHLMADHGIDYMYRAYCANGDCKCKVAGLSYKEALKD